MAIRVESAVLLEPQPVSLASLFTDLWTRPVSWAQANPFGANTDPVPRFAFSPHLGPYQVVLCSDFSWLVPRKGHPGLLHGATRYLKCMAVAMYACDHEGGQCGHPLDAEPVEDYWLFDSGEILQGARTFRDDSDAEAREEAALARAEFSRQLASRRGPVMSFFPSGMAPIPPGERAGRPWYKLAHGMGLPYLAGTFGSFVGGQNDVPRRDEWVVTGV